LPCRQVTWVVVSSVLWGAAGVAGARMLWPERRGIVSLEDQCRSIEEAVLDLGLSEEQQTRIQDILRAHRGQVLQVQDRFSAELKLLETKADEEIAAVLTETQRERLLQKIAGPPR